MFDIVLMALHGAMVAEGYEDCEGELFGRIPALVGPDVIIGAVIDPHFHLTVAMLKHANLLIAAKEYPHTDFVVRAQEVFAQDFPFKRNRCSDPTFPRPS